MKCDEGLAQVLETQVLKLSFRLSLEPILRIDIQDLFF